jgi:cytochrome oxidase Cu insertion factor (SCO1/SenC/PrrC family)
MLRAILLIVALLILLVIGAVWLGLLDLNQTQNAQAPRFEVNQTQEAQAPKFEVKVNPVEVGTTTKNVQIEVPSVSVGVSEQANQQ